MTTPAEKDAMALAVIYSAAHALKYAGAKHDGVQQVMDARAHLAARLEELEKIAAMAKKAQWLQAACWDLADGTGCFIPVDQMKRFDEVFNSLGRALGDIVPMDEDEERELFERPFARATRAEAELAAVRVDGARLDWMDANGFTAYRAIDPIDGIATHCVVVHETQKPRRGNVATTIRESIDAARGAG